MLALTRKSHEKIIVIHNGEELEITLLTVSGNRIQLGFTGSKSFNIIREEVRHNEEKKEKQKR